MWDDLTNEELDAKIIELRTKIEQVASGGIAVIAGEGRRKEWAPGSSKELTALWQSAVNERTKRQNGGRLPGRAIRVRYQG